MFAPLLPAAATFTVAGVLANMILARGERSSIHRTYLALLVAIMAWTGGLVWRFTHLDTAGVHQGLLFIFLGMNAAGPLWFLLSALYTRSSLVDEQPWLKVAIFVPSVLAYAAFLTNDRHGLYASELSHAALSAGPRVWGGPVFWMSVAVIYLLSAAGTALLLSHAWRLRRTPEWRRGLQLGAAALAPVALSLVYVFRILPVPFDLTPVGLCVTVSIFYGALARWGVLEALPLVRRDVIEDLHDGVILSDSGGIVFDSNPAAREILGLGTTSLAGLRLADVVCRAVAREAREEVRRRIEALMVQGRSRLSAPRFETRFRTELGRRVDLSVAPVGESSGDPAGIYAVLRDCTEQHRYEQVVRQSQKLESVGVLAAGVAHEVNNPLAFIQANLGTLQHMADTVERNVDRLPEKDARELVDLREVLEDSQEGIARISRIVDRLRRFSRTSEDPVVRLDANAVVRDAIRFAHLDPKELTIEPRLEAGLPPIHGSRDALTQVLLNLLLNAAQAVSGCPEGRIEVETRLERTAGAGPGEPDVQWVVVEVRDNGRGVPESIRGRIFDPFFTTKAPDQGTGLGLAIAFDIARDHQGHLELLSDAGQGACFSLRIPAAP